MTADAELCRRHEATHRAAYRLFASGSPGGTVVELDGGVQAVITPALPERSLFNAVLYTEPDALLVKKPFSTELLIEALRSVLAERAAP